MSEKDNQKRRGKTREGFEPSHDLNDSPLLVNVGLELLVQREEGLSGDVRHLEVEGEIVAGGDLGEEVSPKGNH